MEPKPQNPPRLIMDENRLVDTQREVVLVYLDLKKSDDLMYLFYSSWRILVFLANILMFSSHPLFTVNIMNGSCVPDFFLIGLRKSCGAAGILNSFRCWPCEFFLLSFLSFASSFQWSCVAVNSYFKLENFCYIFFSACAESASLPRGFLALEPKWPMNVVLADECQSSNDCLHKEFSISQREVGD